MRRRHPQQQHREETSSSSLMMNQKNDDNDGNDVWTNHQDSQRAIYFGGFHQPVYEKMIAISSKTTQKKKNHVWVQVHAVGVNPVDAKQVIGDKLNAHWTNLRKWAHRALVQHTRVGFDFSGIVVDNDDNDNCSFPVGTRVLGTMPPLQGSYAEYIQVPLHQLAQAPQCCTMEEAAALPLVGLTALQALQPHLTKNNDSHNVLIIGGSGGTGHMALQVARFGLQAPRVVTICSTKNVDFCYSCGATHVIDYNQKEKHEVVEQVQALGPFDVILDCVTSADPVDAQHDYPQLIRRRRPQNDITTPQHIYQRLGGQWKDWVRAGLSRGIKTMVSPFVFNNKNNQSDWYYKWVWWPDTRERLFWIRFPHSSKELETLAEWVDAGILKPPRLSKIYPQMTATTVQQAFDDILTRRVQGKIVIRVVQNQNCNTNKNSTNDSTQNITNNDDNDEKESSS